MTIKEEKKKQKQYKKGISISISLKAHAKLEKMKVHPNQSLAEVVDKLLRIKRKWGLDCKAV